MESKSTYTNMNVEDWVGEIFSLLAALANQFISTKIRQQAVRNQKI